MNDEFLQLITDRQSSTMSEDADDHAAIRLTVPPVDRQLAINIRHFHQHLTDNTQA